MGNGKDNDLGQAAPQEAQRSWVTVAEAAVTGALATDVYNDVKAAGKAIADKIRKPPPPPPGGSASGSGRERWRCQPGTTSTAPTR
jgi:hypothetical protein